jgi:hypothetical protein
MDWILTIPAIPLEVTELLRASQFASCLSSVTSHIIVSAQRSLIIHNQSVTRMQYSHC